MKYKGIMNKYLNQIIVFLHCACNHAGGIFRQAMAFILFHFLGLKSQCSAVIILESFHMYGLIQN